MWLAKSIYEPLPAIYILIGAILIGAGFYTSEVLWQSVLIIPGLLLLLGGLVLILRRRAYRASRSRSPFDEIS
jgi:hypothetical protein